MIAIELFSCAGGMAEGFRRAGITFNFAFDKAPDHCDSYKKNLGHRPIEMDVRDLLRLVRGGWRPCGVIDFLCADPPCTPWSRSGKRKGLDDERDMLRETCDLIALLRPRAYLIGNVPGLQDSSSWGVVQEVIGGLSAHGYCTADYAQLNASSYGVPQHRVRPFWFGHLDGPCLRWPVPTHGDPEQLRTLQLPGVDHLKPWVTCRDALAHLAGKELGRPVRMTKFPRHHRGSNKDKPVRTISGNQNGDGVVIYNERHRPAECDAPASTIVAKDRGQSTVLMVRPNHEPSDPGAPSKTITASTGGGIRGGHAVAMTKKRRTPRTSQGMRTHSAWEPGHTITAEPARVGAGSGAVLDWPWDRPSTTVQADERIPPPDHHPEEGSWQGMPNAIVLSEKAAAILQGFPEGWKFCGKTKKVRWSQIGQAMSVGLAEAVAHAIRRWFDGAVP